MAESPLSSSRSTKKVRGCSDRLAGLSPREPMELPPLTPRKVLTRQAEQQHIKSVYADALEHRRKRLDDNAAKQVAAEQAVMLSHRVVMGQEELNDTIHRLSDEGVLHRRATVEATVQKYLKGNDVRNRTKVNNPSLDMEYLNGEQLRECNDRLYRKAREHERATMQRLVDKYIRPVPAVKRTQAEMEAAAKRLSKSSNK
jgi:hypothetical protein